MTAKLSVIVPFYNVEAYIEACLESLARQTMRDFEVIMVDDGSPDGSALIAKSYAQRDPRFRLVQQENKGLGPARNTGLRHACGEYIAFADSDDILARYAYELLIGSLEKTGSDIACGHVRRFSGAGVWPSWIHDHVFTATLRRTDAGRHPTLLYDRTAWNKVYRRSFWDEHGFVFPDSLYEDAPVTVAAHVKAKAVDVFRDVVYFWRERDGGELSITQRRAEICNVRHRMMSVFRVGAFLAEQAPEIKPVFDKSVLDIDLRIVVETLVLANPAERRELLADLKSYLAGISPAVRESVSASKRLKYHLAEREMFDELAEVLQAEVTREHDVPLVRRGLIRARWFADYPFRGDRARGVPDRVYDVTDELELSASVDGVAWCGDRLRIEGHAFIRRLDMTLDSRLDVWLQHVRTERRIELQVERVHRPDVTARSRQAWVCYDGSGFAVEIETDRLKVNGRWKSAVWQIHVAVRTNGMRRAGTITNQALGPAQWPPFHEVADEVRVQVAVTDDETIAVRVQPIRALVTGVRHDGDTVEVSGWFRGRANGPVALRTSRGQGASSVSVPAVVTQHPDGHASFVARLPLSKIASEPDLVERQANVPTLGEGVQWNFAIDHGNRRRRLNVTDGIPAVRQAFGGKEVTLTRTRFGNLTAVERSCRPVVEHAEWTGNDHLVVSGTYADKKDRPEELIVRRRRSCEEYRFPLIWKGLRFTVALRPGRVAKQAGELPLASGTWDLLVTTTAGEVAVVAERAYLASLPAAHVAGTHEFRLLSHHVDALHLRVRKALTDDERGSYAQRIIQERDYPLLLRRPLRDAVVFDSYQGAQYSCNPRAVYEELERRGSGLEHIWVSQDGQFATPGGGRAVLTGSREHYEALAQARFIVGNYGQFPWFAKRKGQLYLQTWHGTPLKRLAYDLRAMPFPRTETLAWMEREVPRWDVLISPNPFTTAVMRHAFRYEGEILESGYPRNDILKSPERDRIAAEVRQRLGIRAGKRVVLYAPTWRDDQHIARGKRGFSMELDLARSHAALGDDHVLLVRTHYLVTDRSWSHMNGFVVDASFYPDIADLYLVADVLVTDYSSAMFDFAGTGKPMVFFTYDLERYRDYVRGFYFDFEAEAPGPLVRTSENVLEALRDVDAMTKSYEQAYAAFVAKFCPYDDGHATARVIDRVFT